MYPPRRGRGGAESFLWRKSAVGSSAKCCFLAHAYGGKINGGE